VEKIQAFLGEKTAACATGSPDLVGRNTHGGSDLIDHDLLFQIPTLPVLDTAHRFDTELALIAITVAWGYLSTSGRGIGRHLWPFQWSTKFSYLSAGVQSVQCHEENASDALVAVNPPGSSGLVALPTVATTRQPGLAWARTPDTPLASAAATATMDTPSRMIAVPGICRLPLARSLASMKGQGEDPQDEAAAIRSLSRTARGDPSQ
jgi:hypothetical protein